MSKDQKLWAVHFYKMASDFGPGPLSSMADKPKADLLMDVARALWLDDDCQHHWHARGHCTKCRKLKSDFEKADIEIERAANAPPPS